MSVFPQRTTSSARHLLGPPDSGGIAAEIGVTGVVLVVVVVVVDVVDSVVGASGGGAKVVSSSVSTTSIMSGSSVMKGTSTTGLLEGNVGETRAGTRKTGNYYHPRNCGQLDSI